MSTELNFYRRHVDPEIDRRMMHHAFTAVLVAHFESGSYPSLELDAVPPFRRLTYQSSLLYGAFPPGTAVFSEEHNGGTHVVVRAGDVAITSLTRSHLPGRLDIQPYQDTLARGPQGELFASNKDEPPSKLWALMIYGGHYRSRHLTLCRMSFPTPDGYFAPGTIDMLAEYPDIAARFDDREYADRQVLNFIEARQARRA